MRHSKTFTLAGCAVLAFLLLNNINLHSAMAIRDDQNPNYQISSSNTSNDYGSWVRWSVTTNEAFHATPSTTFDYSYQMNTLLNSCSAYQSGCTWFLQGIAYAQVQSVSPHGAYVNMVFEEGFVGSNSQNFCQPVTEPNINVNSSGYVVLQQTTLNASSDVVYLVSISHGSTNDYSYSKLCALPTFPYTFGAMHYFDRTEGVVVGDSGLHDVSFSPLSSTIFSPFYLDMVSNYNDMSSYYVSTGDTLTAETSNLYQSVGQSYGESYGSMYLYTQIGSEITKTDS